MPDKSSLPNIVFIMADDMGYGDPGCYGAEKIPTPNMDRLATEGVRFTDAHSAAAVCTPSRYSVLTGRYCWRSRLKRWVLGGFGEPLIEDGRMTVADLLRRHGYATASVGKWHLGLGWTLKDGRPRDQAGEDAAADGADIDYTAPLRGGPTAHGFDYSFNISGSLDMPPYCFIENDRCAGVPVEAKSPVNPQQRPGLMTPGWDDAAVDTTFARRAAEWIGRAHAEDPDRPLFLYLTPSAPHRPCVPPPQFEGRSSAGLRGDMVTVVDWMVGEVDAALERCGRRENTLLIVTSDNGARLTCFDGNDYGHRSCGDLRGQKADIWDGGHREPFIARWPARIAPGGVCDEPICLSDLMATCASIVGDPLPSDAGEDSCDILPALCGEPLDAPIREAIVHHSGNGMFSLRQGRWKLIRGLGSGGFSEPRGAEPGPGDPVGQLYDMADDPAEGRNLYAERPEIVERLTAILDRYIADGRST